MRYLLYIAPNPGIGVDDVNRVIATSTLGGYRFANMMWVISSLENADILQQRFVHLVNPSGRLLLNRLGDDRQGWMPQEFWDWMRSHP